MPLLAGRPARAKLPKLTRSQESVQEVQKPADLGIRRRKIGNPNEEKLTKLGTVENLSNFHAKLLRHIGFAPPRVRGHRLARSLKSAAERRSARSSVMQDETELWMKLCVEAAIERDPHKFLEIAKEICELLKSKQKRLGIVPSKPGNC